jgi:hypothetical protein
MGIYPSKSEMMGRLAEQQRNADESFLKGHQHSWLIDGGGALAAVARIVRLLPSLFSFRFLAS